MTQAAHYEADLWLRILMGDEAALREAWEYYVPLVRYIASSGKRMNNWPMELDDLVQIGAIGLWQALQRYSFAAGVRFESYAVFRIRGEMVDQMRTQRSRIDRGHVVHFTRWSDLAEEYESSGDPKPHKYEPRLDDPEFAAIDDRDMIESVLRGLSKADADIMRDYYLNGRTLRAIGESRSRSECRIGGILKAAERRARQLPTVRRVMEGVAA